MAAQLRGLVEQFKIDGHDSAATRLSQPSRTRAAHA
jgi:hypothetical protein